MSIADLYRNGGVNPATVRRRIACSFTLSGGSAAVANYPVKLLIGYFAGGALNCDGYCSADFHDIWFTNAAGTPLPFWIESIASGVATVWLNADSIAAGGSTFVLHYGDPFGGSASNGAATFSLFDDFSGDLTLWDTVGSPSISGGLLTLSGADCAIDSKTTFGIGYAVRCLSRSVTTGQYCMPVQWRNLPETAYARWINMGSNYEYYNTQGATISTTILQSTTFHVREIRKISASSLAFYHDASSTLYTLDQDASASNRAGIRANGQSVVVDWILVRKIIATEHVVTAVGATFEESA